MPVHRIHPGRVAGFYLRAMNVVQPVWREEASLAGPFMPPGIPEPPAATLEGPGPSLQPKASCASGHRLMEGTAGAPFEAEGRRGRIARDL